ncbi:MAG: hypothetical protein SGI92_04715 [Bryobacteraceae bacterium]|nr:hypothetical protein [Bryobacteraceae bacterium]
MASCQRGQSHTGNTEVHFSADAWACRSSALTEAKYQRLRPSGDVAAVVGVMVENVIGAPDVSVMAHP